MINLYEILKDVLNESVSSDYVNDAINNKYQVIINYSDEDNHAPKKRIIEPYAYGMSKAGNEVVRAYQYNGDTYRGVPKWKLFRLDRIQSWTPTDRHFNMTPSENGWDAQEYNSIGDKTMSIVLNQVSFDRNDNEKYSPNDSLNKIRKQRQNFANSIPINIKQMDDKESEPILNQTVQSINNNTDNTSEKSDFQKMLDRNLEITRQEKAKRGFSLSNNNNKENDKAEPIVNNTVQGITNDNQENNNKQSDFQKMLDRNLEITRQEKAKRGFSLNDKNKH